MRIRIDRRSDQSIAFYIDGDLQFDSHDERIYHECLALPALALAERRLVVPLKTLIVGGGDGLSARELCKSDRIKSIDLVDYSKEVLQHGQETFASLNDSSLKDARVSLHVEDAWTFVERAAETSLSYDLIVCDLTVPDDIAGARFHSIDWYQLLRKLCTQKTILSINGVSPSATPKAFWSVYNSILGAGLNVCPFKVTIPSFNRLGYGPDWAFFLASQDKIEPEELDQTLQLREPRFILKDTEQLRTLFQFPEELLAFQSKSSPAEGSSEILLHYFRNSEFLVPVTGAIWDALNSSTDAFVLPEPDRGDGIFPPEIKEGLNTCNADELFNHVTALMPALHRYQTRQSISAFLDNPIQFLQAIDLPALVAALLQRASELPQKLVDELRLLKERLADWSGDYESLMTAGQRILTVVALVVIVGNLVHPDAVYGKGEGGRGGGDRGGDRGDRGGRDFGRDRGFDHRGFGRFGRWDGWRGGWRHGYGWGTYGWARPYHGGWWGGGWGWPGYYGGGYVNVNLSNQSTDEEGNQYPQNNYRYNANSVVQNYNWGSPQSSNQSDQSNQSNRSNQSDPAAQTLAQSPGSASGGDEQVIDSAGRYKLAPQTDILADGKIAIQLANGAYLLLGPSMTQVMDQTSSAPVMTLATDPSLMWQVGTEIKRQRFSLNNALQNQQFANSSADSNDGYDDKSELDNMRAALDHLRKASDYLGELPDPQQSQSAPPVPNAIEVFAGVWMLPQGNLLVFKRSDGSLVYMDAKKVYSDEGRTALNLPYPNQFKAVVLSFLSKLVKDEVNTKASLLQDLKDGQSYMSTLQQELNDYQSGGQNAGGSGLQTRVSGTLANSGSDAWVSGAGTQPGGAGGGAGGGATGDLVQFGSRQIPRNEAIRRTTIAIRRTQKKIDAINKQLAGLPGEIVAANKMIVAFKS